MDGSIEGQFTELPKLSAETLRRMNPHHLWAQLKKDQQKAMGALAVARALAEVRFETGWEAVFFEAGQALEHAVVNALGTDAVQSMPLPDLSSFGVKACAVCGCTDDCGCEEGCWWVAPGLCSSCAPRVVEAAADTAPALLAFIEPGKGTAPDADPTLLACLNAGLIEFYSGGRGQTAWVATRLGKLLTVAAASAREVEAHD